jgi:type II secretory pathway component GspD/PulD (secretin)
VEILLTIQDNLISLNANEASLKEIIEEIGRKMNIEVVAHLSRKEKVSIEFYRLKIDEVLIELREYVKIAYIIKNSEIGQGKISKIIVFPKMQATELSRPMTQLEIRQSENSVKPESSVGEETAKQDPRPGPFKFEFDPTKYMDKDK